MWTRRRRQPRRQLRHLPGRRGRPAAVVGVFMAEEDQEGRLPTDDDCFPPPASLATGDEDDARDDCDDFFANTHSSTSRRGSSWLSRARAARGQSATDVQQSPRTLLAAARIVSCGNRPRDDSS